VAHVFSTDIEQLDDQHLLILLKLVALAKYRKKYNKQLVSVLFYCAFCCFPSSFRYIGGGNNKCKKTKK